MEHSNFKSSVISNLIWKFMEKGGGQVVQFIVQILLARMLFPEDFGVIALLTIFINISNTIIQSGFNMALVQKKNTDALDFSSVFYLNILTTVLLYAMIFFIAPILANFFEINNFSILLRILSINLFFGALNSVQIAFISKSMAFKKLFLGSLGGIIVSGVVGLLLAAKGFGIWALVYQQLINQLLVTVILWFIVKWRPIFAFSFPRLKVLFSFGWKILASNLLFNLYNNLRTLFIGKLYSPEILGFYNRGSQFPSILVDNINGSIQSVMLPAFSTQQDNKVNLKRMMQKSIITSSFIVFPMMFGLAAIAKPLVEILLTDKWIASVPFVVIFCFTYALRPIHMSNQQAINALGRSDITLKLNLIKRFVDIVILGATVSFGVHVIAIGGIISGIIGSIINAAPNKKILNYGYIEQLKDVIPSLVLSTIMGIIVYSIQLFTMPALSTLIVQIIIGTLLYYSMAKALKLKSYEFLKTTLIQYFSTKKSKGV